MASLSTGEGVMRASRAALMDYAEMAQLPFAKYTPTPSLRRDILHKVLQGVEEVGEHNGFGARDRASRVKRCGRASCGKPMKASRFLTRLCCIAIVLCACSVFSPRKLVSGEKAFRFASVGSMLSRLELDELYISTQIRSNSSMNANPDLPVAFEGGTFGPRLQQILFGAGDAVFSAIMSLFSVVNGRDSESLPEACQAKATSKSRHQTSIASGAIVRSKVTAPRLACLVAFPPRQPTAACT
jgi:hypothetical protein